MQFGVKMQVSLKCTTSNGPNSYNLVMYIKALAFANNAFKNNFTYLEAIYKLVALPKLDYIRLQ